MSSSSNSREYSPDWLRNVQAPAAAAASVLALISSSSSSSESDQLPISSVIRNKSPQLQEPKSSVWDLTSDSEHELSEGQPDADADEETTSLSKLESSRKKLKLEQQDTEILIKVTEQENDDPKGLEREAAADEKQTAGGPYISSSRLPLLLADKVQRSKVLVECEGESIDLSGDLGSVGRVVISDSPSGNQDMLLDLKGTIYKTTIMPSRTFCVVSFGQSEAKIEAIMNDFIQLKPQSNVYEAETMVEGTLEGFSFESEDEGDKHATRQADENDPQTNGKPEATKRKGKTAVKKPVAKKVNKKKAPVAKKTKSKK
ncbi:uncharacterized protein LOC143633398 isoform X2 [Bidens hawaiensis]|uniref:uncharacterized protein LOC143633398 isoform X2 n=1 Tax=Bidens hawaiensis TaxID=980011 RepID=UPI004049943F